MPVQRREGRELLPSANVLRAFEELSHGAATQILADAKAQLEHERDIERRMLEAEIADAAAERAESRLGQVFAFLISIVTIGSGTYAATHDAQLPGTIIGTGGLVSLATVFIVGRRSAAAEPAAASVVPPASGEGEQERDRPAS